MIETIIDGKIYSINAHGRVECDGEWFADTIEHFESEVDFRAWIAWIIGQTAN